MGASVTVYWPWITDEQRDLCPYFSNDCKYWGDWMAAIRRQKALIKNMRDVGLGALLTGKTEGIEDEYVEWVSPDELIAASDKLRDLLLEKDQLALNILDIYALKSSRPDLKLRFLQDLSDIKAIAEWAKANGANVMTLEVDW